ncbi:hypothetical protein [Asaia spathodeae]|uniref:Uncharacterized protein n=1 Tax=Asaia spathodeae TaxID=657016 RepID=A0ABX2P6F2_9PROT|nr:hypothetical protein [Asaia spathodeae]GBR12384.1 hypothetical protein AA105894_0510 [Asaia spathodeae NBRC 105894]
MGISLLQVENALGAIRQLDRAAPVTLGNLVLSGPEVPDELVIGGRQVLIIHRLLGGGRVIDSVGNDPARLVLTGRFIGPMATSRARRLETMREAAQVLAFSVADLSARVWIAEFSWSYRARGTICPYRLVLEREVSPPVLVPISSETASMDMVSGLGVFSTMLGQMTDSGWIGTTMISSVVGQIMPIAQILGAGGAVAHAQDALGKASSLWQSATNVSRIPTAVAAVGSDLSVAGNSLLQVRNESGLVLDTAQISNAVDLVTLAQNAGAATLSVDAGSYVSRAQTLIGS